MHKEDIDIGIWGSTCSDVYFLCFTERERENGQVKNSKYTYNGGSE